MHARGNAFIWVRRSDGCGSGEATACEVRNHRSGSRVGLNRSLSSHREENDPLTVLQIEEPMHAKSASAGRMPHLHLSSLDRAITRSCLDVALRKAGRELAATYPTQPALDRPPVGVCARSFVFNSRPRAVPDPSQFPFSRFKPRLRLVVIWFSTACQSRAGRWHSSLSRAVKRNL
jgi:hypothetical protein